MSCYRFIETEKAQYPVSRLCRVLGVSRSGYYAWRHRGVSARARADHALTDQIRHIHAQSRMTYGAPRIHAELQAQGVRCGRKRIARLMRQASLEGCHRRWRRSLTRRDPQQDAAPDRVERDFQVPAPNRLWVADLTPIATEEGWLYLAFVVDAYSRRVVGWAMAEHVRTELVLAALNLALGQRQPAPGLIHHSDQGSQYTAFAFGTRLEESGLVASMGSVGDASDNALAEAFVATLKSELVHRQHWHTRQQAQSAIFAYIETWYNPRRRHSALDYCSPVDYEGRCQQTSAA